MKKIVFVLAILLIFCVVALGIGYVTNSDAGGGCCVQRSDSNTQNWYRNGMTFRQCRDKNQQIDNDDVYRPTGLYWWNRDC